MEEQSSIFYMKKVKTIFLSAIIVAFSLIGSQSVFAAEELAPLDIKLPIPAFLGTPTDVPDDEHLEKPTDEPRPQFMAPKGCKNLALNKRVTGSVQKPQNGSYDLVTNGDKEFNDDSYLELPRKTQWVQIDLEKPSKIYAIVVWHAHNTPHIYRDVIVQLSNDPEFKEGVKTVYNNDYDNSSGQGIGNDKEYYESHEGRLIDAKGAEARYLRFYSRGSSYSSMNRYIEIEVWGLE